MAVKRHLFRRGGKWFCVRNDGQPACIGSGDSPREAWWSQTMERQHYEQQLRRYQRGLRYRGIPHQHLNLTA